MRYDMAKVLIEQARTQSSNRSRKWAKKYKYVPDCDYEDEITRVHGSRRWQYGYDYKQSTDVLGPLKGYLRSKVGQPWDEVYSEICKYMDRRSTVGAHIFTHLWQYVDKNCWIGEKTGKVYTDGDRGTAEPSDYYVHPWTGLLCESECLKNRRRWHWDKKKNPVLLVQIENGKAYEWIKGFWYYTEYTMVTLYTTVPYWRGSTRTYRQSYEEKVYQLKRQLGKKELKQLGLSNKYLKLE